VTWPLDALPGELRLDDIKAGVKKALAAEHTELCDETKERSETCFFDQEV